MKEGSSSFLKKRTKKLLGVLDACKTTELSATEALDLRTRGGEHYRNDAVTVMTKWLTILAASSKPRALGADKDEAALEEMRAAFARHKPKDESEGQDE